MADDKLSIKASSSGVEIGVEGESAKGLSSALFDAISPFTESLGTLGDEIRYFRIHRHNTVLKTLNEAARLRKINNIQSNPVDIKLLNPWIEGASLETEGDQGISDLWARLLAKAPSEFSSNYATFIKTLTMIGSSDAKVLQSLQEGTFAHGRTPILDLVGQKSGIYHEVFDRWSDRIFSEYQNDKLLEHDQQEEDTLQIFFNDMNAVGRSFVGGFRACQIMIGPANGDEQGGLPQGSTVISQDPNFGRDYDSFQILEAHNLVSAVRDSFGDTTGKYGATVFFYEITPLGRMLLSAVSIPNG